MHLKYSKYSLHTLFLSSIQDLGVHGLAVILLPARTKSYSFILEWSSFHMSSALVKA